MTEEGSAASSEVGASTTGDLYMRTSHEAQVASVGEHEVPGNFARIGWGPTNNRPHDVGTDLWVQVRDAEGVDLAILVGAQVRTGDSYFRNSDVVDGKPGWWHDGLDARHVQHWLRHRAPHLIVLHCLDTRVSHWAHVNSETAISTGKGYKVFVPESQTVDREHLDDLIAAARYQPEPRQEIKDEVAETTSSAVRPGQRLRYALAAPNLIAPHRNSGFSEKVDAEQGVALLAQARFRDLKQFAKEHEDVPDPENVPRPDQAPLDVSWAWQFVGAIWDWAKTDDVGWLTGVFGTAPDGNSRAASGVLLSCALLRLERHSEALDVLDGLLDDELEPADRGWGLVQRARVRADLGDADGSRSDGEAAIEELQGTAGDEAAKAFDAAARWNLLALDPLGADFTGALKTSDNAASKWRSQSVSWALSEVQAERFRSWADQESIVIIGHQEDVSGLLAAELNGDFIGYHGAWMEKAALRACHRLMSASDSPDDALKVVDGLDALRISGDSQSLERAVKRLYWVGPIAAVAETASRMPVEGWTHTTASANFQLLATAGDLFDRQKATGLLRWCAQLATGDTASFIKRVRPWFWVEYLAIKAVAGLLPAADDSTHDEVAYLLSQGLDPESQLPASDIETVFGRLDSGRTSPAAQDSLWELAQRDEGDLGAAALAWLAASGHVGAQTEAIKRAGLRDLKVLPAVLQVDPSKLGKDMAGLLIGWFEDMAADRLSAAREGQYRLGGYDGAHLLAHFNLILPELERWETIMELLGEALVDAGSKRPTCTLLATRAADLPEGVRSELAINIDAISQAASGFGQEQGIGGTRTMLRIALGTVNADQAEAESAELVFGTPRDREDAARLLGAGLCPANQSLLSALAADSHPAVRRAAAIATGKLLPASPNSLIIALAWKLADDKGADLPSGLLHGLLQTQQESPIGTEIAQHLLNHPSAWLRRLAKRIP